MEALEAYTESGNRVLEQLAVLGTQDGLRRIGGIGGAEFVFTKRLDRLSVGELWADDFEIEVGAMTYGLEIDGILGVNFLIRAGAVVDLARTEVRPAP